MPKLVTLGRIVDDHIYDGEITTDAQGKKSSVLGEFQKRTPGSSTLNILDGVRKMSPDMELGFIAELVAGVNDDAVDLLAAKGIDYDRDLINPDSSTPVTTAQWVVTAADKHLHNLDAAKPTAYFAEALANGLLLGAGDALVLCAEYTTDNWDKFSDFVALNARNEAHIWTVPNTRAKTPEKEAAYRENLHRQLAVSSFCVMAHSDLEQIFHNKDITANIDAFRATFSNFTGMLLVTNGASMPVLLDMNYGARSHGAAPVAREGRQAEVGSGDLFTGALFAQLLDQPIDLYRRPSFEDVEAAIPNAHLVASNQPPLAPKRATPEPDNAAGLAVR